MTQVKTSEPSKSAQAEREPKYSVVAAYLREQVETGAMKPGDRLPSMAEIQERFAVSLSTVQKVHDMLDQEGLIVREHGRGTFVASRRRTGLIGFIGGVFSQTQRFHHSFQVAEGISEVTAREDMQIVEINEQSLAGADKVDGVLLCVGYPTEISARLPAGLPRVALSLPCPGISSVITDDSEGAKNAVLELVSRGHRRIATFVEEPAELPRLRLQGYFAGLEAASIAPESTWVRRYQGSVKSRYREWAAALMRNWISDGWQEAGCTALLAQNDLAALGAMEALQAAGIKVPEQVSVIGFDGAEVCDYVSPRLSAVEIPWRQIGAEGMELLARHIDDRNYSPRTVVLPTRFRDRETVRTF